MTGEACRAELALRGQRGMLTDSGRLALDAHLADCESCRVDQDVLAGLADESAVDIRDGARIERLSAGARAWARGRQGRVLGIRRGPSRMWAAAAALVGLAGSAAAATWWVANPPVPTPRTPSFALAPRAPTEPWAPPVAGPPILPSPGSPPAVAGPAPAVARAARAAPTLTAAALLRQAGDARRSGDTDRAVALYRRLQADFANSSEALLARVALGSLLVERGRARDALLQFDRYLAAAPHGVLTPEALYGRARALTALGDGAAAELAWQRLLRDFPGSAYAPLARRRIAEPR
jgi:TolA-binding protein